MCTCLVSATPPPVFFYFFFIFFTPLGCGLRRWEARRLNPEPSPSQEGGPPQLSVRQTREGGHFLFLPLGVLPQSLSCSSLDGLLESCSKTPGLSHQPQDVRGAGSVRPKLPWPRLGQTLSLRKVTRVLAPGRAVGLPYIVLGL